MPIIDLSDVPPCGRPIEETDPTSPRCGLALNHDGGCWASLSGDDLAAFQRQGEELLQTLLAEANADGAGLRELLKH